MQLVEQHVMKPTDARYQAIDQGAFASKNLYNAANYEMRQSFIHPSGLPIEIQTCQMHVDGVRIVPRTGYYVVEVVYEEPEIQADVDASLSAGIDMGINTLTALTSNKEGFVHQKSRVGARRLLLDRPYPPLTNRTCTV